MCTLTNARTRTFLTNGKLCGEEMSRNYVVALAGGWGVDIDQTFWNNTEEANWHRKTVTA
jgi:hypothetical protein